MRVRYIVAIIMGCTFFATSARADDHVVEPAVDVISAEVTVYNYRFRPAFRATREYILELLEADNREPEQSIGYLRLSGEGEDALWLKCGDIVAEACDDAPAPKASRPRAVSPARASGIPLCPGDPRCPVSKSGGK
jgi:hypothetical protein